MDIIENIIGGGGGGKGGSLFGEAREALVGGCWGVFMSAGFFFVFFATGLAMLFGILDIPIVLSNRAVMFPFVCILGVSAIGSPFVGALFGAQSGIYSVVRHIGCFILYIGALVGGMFAAAMFL